MVWTRLGFASAILGLIASAARTPARAQAPGALCIRVPDGMGSGFVTTSPSEQPGMHYIVVQNVNIANASQAIVSYQLTDFSLIVKGKKYHPSARPGLGAIDISAKTGVCGPHQSVRGNLAFLVPSNVTQGNVEFRPSNWIVDGVPVIFCCAWDCR